ncbi:MAG: hypothetical protein FWD89_04040 [Firmicutes bacterium]|nr:hypothetical protein [Bacillota bacterium]MCL2771454.1 hypothetical protein [Bacillota bacterium]
MSNKKTNNGIIIEAIRAIVYFPFRVFWFGWKHFYKFMRSTTFKKVNKPLLILALIGLGFLIYWLFELLYPVFN